MSAKYPGIVVDLRARIEKGEWQTNETLPSEDKLAGYYHVSRMTLRKAIEVLSNEGLVETRHGTGNVVVDPKPLVRVTRWVNLGKVRRPMNDDHFLSDAADKQFQPTIHEEIRFEPARAEVAEILEIDPGAEVCRRDRVVRARGEAMQLTTTYLPREITRDSDMEQRGLAEKDLYRLLEKAGYRPLKFRETVRCRPLSEDEKQRLDNLDGLAITVERTARTASRPVAVHHLAMSPKRCELTYEWDS